jgi:type IV pilus assembly protein PilC
VASLKPRVNQKMHKSVDTADIQAFFAQLATLFRAGTPIHDAIVIASEQCQSVPLRVVIEQVSHAVAGGTSLNEALAAHSKLFKIEWIEIIRSGENSGLLGEVLDRLVMQIDAASQLQGKLVSAMIYPSICMTVAVGSVAVMLVKVVPTFASMFKATGQELPGITQWVMSVSDALSEHGLMILGIIVSIVLIVRRYISTPDGRKFKDRLLVSLPLVGDVIVQVSMQKYSNNVSVLLRAGLPLLDAIHSLKGIFRSNSVYEEAMDSVARYVARGGQLADGVERTQAFTTFAVSMTRIGEDSGTLPECLDEVEVFYRRKVETLVDRLTGSLETAVILFMGVAVSVILTSVYLPMFSMAGGVG